MRISMTMAIATFFAISLTATGYAQDLPMPWPGMSTPSPHQGAVLITAEDRAIIIRTANETFLQIKEGKFNKNEDRLKQFRGMVLQVVRSRIISWNDLIFSRRDLDEFTIGNPA